MRVTVVLQDKLVAKAKKLLGKKTLSGILNSCLADRIDRISKKQFEARLDGQRTEGICFMSPFSAKFQLSSV